MRRGEVWWAVFPQPVGRRQVLLLSRDSAYQVRTSVSVAPLSSTVRGIPVEVALGAEEGFTSPTVINLDNILTIPRSYLKEAVTALPAEKMSEVAQAIKFSIELE